MVFNTIGAESRPMTSRKETTQSGKGTLCPMPQVAQLIGGKWKLIVLQILIFHGTHRFNELRRKIEGITQAMLTNQLRALEEDGLISRKVYAEVPPRVEYSATQKAMDLNEMFEAMHRWWVTYEG